MSFKYLYTTKQIVLFTICLLGMGSVVFAGYIHHIPQQMKLFIDPVFYANFWWYYGLRLIVSLILARFMLALLILGHVLREGCRAKEGEETFLFCILGLGIFVWICLGLLNVLAFLSICIMFFGIAAKFSVLLSGRDKPTGFPKSYLELVDATMEFSPEKFFSSDRRSFFSGVTIFAIFISYFFGMNLYRAERENLAIFEIESGVVEGAFIGRSSLNYFISVAEITNEVKPFLAGKCGAEKFFNKWTIDTGMSEECIDPLRSERTRFQTFVLPTHRVISIRAIDNVTTDHQ